MQRVQTKIHSETKKVTRRVASQCETLEPDLGFPAGTKSHPFEFGCAKLCLLSARRVVVYIGYLPELRGVRGDLA